MKNLLQLPIVFGLMSMFLFSSCFTLNNFQSAKTLEKGQTELGVGLATGSTFDLEGNDLDTIDGIIQRGTPLYDFVLYGRHGITDDFDFGYRLSSIGDIGVDFKYMAAGNKNSTFAFSPGVGLSSNLLYLGVARMYQIEIPLHTSFDITDNFTVILTPRYIGQSSAFTIFDDNSWVNYAGGSLGFEAGKTTIFSLGFNYLKSLNYETISTFNVAAGLRFRFGGSKNGQ